MNNTNSINTANEVLFFTPNINNKLTSKLKYKHFIYDDNVDSIGMSPQLQKHSSGRITEQDILIRNSTKSKFIIRSTSK